MRSTVLYCHLVLSDRRPGGSYWADFSPHPETARMYDYGEAPVYEVTVSEMPDEPMLDSYWGWWDAQRGAFTMVYYAQALVEMCFPYGSKVEEERGRGKLMPVAVSGATIVLEARERRVTKPSSSSTR